MPETNVAEPHPNRMATRPKNATTHPGTAAEDALRVRRRGDPTEKEERKKRKEAKRQETLTKEANETSGGELIARLEAELARAREQNQYPRQRVETKSM